MSEQERSWAVQFFFMIRKMLAPEQTKVLQTMGGAVAAILLSMLITLYIILRLPIDKAKGKYQDEPLNIEAFDYNLVRSLTTLRGRFISKYPFGFIAITASVAFLLACTAFGLAIRYPMDRVKTGIYVGILGFIALMVWLMILIYPKRKLGAIQTRLNTLNRYVQAHMIKNCKVLDLLRQVPTTPTEEERIALEAIKIAFYDQKESSEASGPQGPERSAKAGAQASVQELAKAIYTIAIARSLQSINIKNPNRTKAIDTVLNCTRMMSMYYTPSDYMYRKFSYISSDLGTLKDQIENMLPSKTVAGAFSLFQTWISQTNEYANTIEIEDGMKAIVFLCITVLFLVVIMPILLIMGAYFFYDKLQRYIPSFRIPTAA